MRDSARSDGPHGMVPVSRARVSGAAVETTSVDATPRPSPPEQYDVYLFEVRKIVGAYAKSYADPTELLSIGYLKIGELAVKNKLGLGIPYVNACVRNAFRNHIRWEKREARRRRRAWCSVCGGT